MKPVPLERSEIEVLIQWHREQQYESANRQEDYISAEYHKKRAAVLREALKDAT